MVRGGFSAQSTAKLLLCATVTSMLPAHLSGFVVRPISVATARAFAQSVPRVSFAGGPRVPGGGGSDDGACPLEFEELPYRGAEVRVSARDLHHVDRRVSHDDDKSATTCSTSSDAQFLDDLRSSLKYWSDHDYTSAWLHIPASRAGLVELLTSEATSTHKEHATTDTVTAADIDALSFDLHHVNATESTIVLKKWLRPNAEDKIPPFASHQVGCAGFVLSEDNELLLVREWAGPPSNRTPTKQWKLPGGLLDAGESFEEATCREDIDIDPVEVSACKWMPIEDFLTSQDHPLILHVLDKVFELKNDGESLEKVRNHKGRLRPIVDMAENDVQFANRDPFPTYTGRISK